MAKEKEKTIILANPRGFCAGVDRAIHIVESALATILPPIFVRHEVVHNKYVVDHFKSKGVRFIESLDQVPAGSTLIYSAHGVSTAVQQEAEKRGFKIFDATCPLVTKVHREVKRLDEQGYTIIMIGHKGHPEVEGTMGQIKGTMLLVETVKDVGKLAFNPPKNVLLAYVSQTTLSIDETRAIVTALKARYPSIKAPHKEDICYATQNRQDAVKKLTEECDAIIVVGSRNSSNSSRLREVAAKKGIPAYQVDGAALLKENWFLTKYRIGVTAGASAPEILVKEVLDTLKSWGFKHIIENPGAKENIVFVLPKKLRT